MRRLSLADVDHLIADLTARVLLGAHAALQDGESISVDVPVLEPTGADHGARVFTTLTWDVPLLVNDASPAGESETEGTGRVTLRLDPKTRYFTAPAIDDSVHPEIDDTILY